MIRQPVTAANPDEFCPRYPGKDDDYYVAPDDRFWICSDGRGWFRPSANELKKWIAATDY